jgi:heptosyltransferase-1
MIAFRRELRLTHYDRVLDLQGNVKSGLVTASARGSLKVGFGYPYVREWPNLLATHKKYHPLSGQNIREDYLYLAQSAMEDFTPFPMQSGIQLNLTSQENMQLQPILEGLQQTQKFKILVCAGSNWANKQLSQGALHSFMRSLVKEWNAHFILIWGNAAEKSIAEELQASFFDHSSMINRLSLPALQNLMAEVDLVLAMDSLPLHLAATTSTPTYSVFGASSAQKYKPIGERHHAFQGSCPYGKTFERRCDILRTCKTGACIKQIEGVQLFEHFRAWWSSLNRPLA